MATDAAANRLSEITRSATRVDLMARTGGSPKADTLPVSARAVGNLKGSASAAAGV
jgi:hypothetical protein